MMTRKRPKIPETKSSFGILKQIISMNNIKSLNQSEKSQISDLIEKMIQNYKLVELDLVIDELLQNYLVNDVFYIKILYYKAKKELICHNITEAIKIINLGLNKLKNIEENDKNLDFLNILLLIEKYKCKYLSGNYKESLEYYTALKPKFDLDLLIRIEVSLNIGSIYLLTGDIQSCINIYIKCFNLVKKLEKSFLQIKISNLLGDYYSKLGNFEYSKEFYKLSLGYSEGQNNHYYIGKNLTNLFVMDYFQYYNTIDDFVLSKLKIYQKQSLSSDFFSKIISIFFSVDLRDKIGRLKTLIDEFADQIINPEIIIMVIESLIQFQIRNLKDDYSEDKVHELLMSILVLEHDSKKFNLIIYWFKGLLLKSKINLLKQNFSQSIQILQDGIFSAENLKLTAYSKLFKLEIKKINLVFPLYQISKENLKVKEIFQIQHLNQLTDMFYNFEYRLSLI